MLATGGPAWGWLQIPASERGIDGPACVLVQSDRQGSCDAFRRALAEEKRDPPN